MQQLEDEAAALRAELSSANEALVEARLATLDTLLQHVHATSGRVDAPASVQRGGNATSSGDVSAASGAAGLCLDPREVSLRVLAHANRELLVRFGCPACGVFILCAFQRTVRHLI